MLIDCFFIEQSSCTWREELRTNNVKAKTCLFTGQVDVQYTPITTYNPDFRDNNLCDKKYSLQLILKPSIKKKNEKMSRTIVLELFLPFRLFKKTANIRCTTTSAQILNSHENKTKWGIALKRKTGAAAKHLLIEPWNHWTIEPKISNRSRIWSAAGWCPAAKKKDVSKQG